MKSRHLFLITLFLPPYALAGITADDYTAANALLERNLAGTVKNESVAPHWLGDSSRFWYKRDTADGQEYVVVETTTGEKTPAFDHAALAAAINEVSETEVTAENLGVANESFDADIASLTAVLAGKTLACDLESMLCEVSDPTPPSMGIMPSATGKWLLKRESDNLVLVDAASGEERQLTDDGAPYYSWAKYPDAGLITITLRNTGMQLPPMGAEFSPDDKFLIAPRIDERDVAVNPFVEWVPQDGSLRPKYHPIRAGFMGDRNVIRSDLFVFNIETGDRVAIEVPEEYVEGLGAMSAGVLGWSVEREQAYALVPTAGAKSHALIQIDLNTGKAKVLIEEAADTRVESNTYMYNRPNVRVVNDGDEVIWYSDRTGFGHLYLHDGQTGKQKARITRGDWQVQDIHSVDEANREIYFTGGGKEKGRDPYYRHLYRTSFDGGDATLLTDVDADHHFAPDPVPMFALLFGIIPGEPVIRPDLGVLIDTYSTVSEPPVTVLRSTDDGSVIAELEQADASALFATGWRAPVRQAVKAADGETDIYTVYWAPYEIDGKHPVIDSVYGGPQVIVAPRNFTEAYGGRNPVGQAAQARLGFAVVTTDARGTPLRGKAFSDAGYTEFTAVGIEDHIAAIEQLARKYPEIDTSRVGIHGWSWGGTFSGQAILSRPDFYDVCVSGAGVYDYVPLYSGFESSTGLPEFADGSRYRTEVGEKPKNYDPLDITAMAGNLEGKLMIVYGDLDENVPPSQAFRLVDALVKAGKPYDLLYIPNGTHGGASPGGSAYSMQRRLDYFVEHLMNETPPSGVLINYQQ